MESIREFLEMGGYAAFVWPAVAVVVGGMTLMLVWSIRGLRRRERELKALTGPGSRGASQPGDPE